MSRRETQINLNEIQIEAVDNADYEDEIRIQLGEFLSNQYELLKRTLSYLLIDDLIRAARVCRSWNKTATYLLKQRELLDRIRWHLQCIKPQCEPFNCYKNNINFRSQLILGFQLTKPKKPNIIDEISREKDSFCRIGIPGLKGDIALIYSQRIRVPVSKPDNVFTYFKRRSAAVLFPYSNRFKIVPIKYQEDTSLHSVISDEIELQYGPLQGLLLFTRDMKYVAFTKHYNQLCQQLRRSVPLAGGVFPDVTFQEMRSRERSESYLLLGFHGSIECYSNVLNNLRKTDVELFMKRMRDTLGDIDLEKQQRIAIVIRCIHRPNAEYEDSMYQKYFPDTPAFFLSSYGEYGNAGDSTKKKEANKRMRYDFNIAYGYSSVYFLCTISLPPSTT